MHAPITGAAELPFFITVKPKRVDVPAARLPLPLGRMVMTLPLLSQLGEPFQVAMVFCGGEKPLRPSHPVGSTGRSGAGSC